MDVHYGDFFWEIIFDICSFSTIFAEIMELWNIFIIAPHYPQILGFVEHPEGF